MGITIKILRCNSNCEYCYERALKRDVVVDYERVKSVFSERLKDAYSSCLHGGEPLLIPLPYLKFFLSEQFKKFNSSSIQTNLTLLNDSHIKLFKKYKTHVGISLDGDTDEMNRARKIRVAEIFENMSKLREAKISMSIICVLNKYNADGEKLAWFGLRMWRDFGIRDIRFNPAVIVGKNKKNLELDCKSLIEIYERLYKEFWNNPELRWYPFVDFERAFFNRNLTCVFTECDIFCTEAEMTIMSTGELGNCLHSSEIWLRAESPSRERYLMLQNLPQEHGGCKNCEFWQICKGGCPAAGLKDDWRSRSRFCEVYKYFFQKNKKRFERLGLSFDFTAKSEGKRTMNGHSDEHGDKHGDKKHEDHTDRV